MTWKRIGITLLFASATAWFAAGAGLVALHNLELAFDTTVGLNTTLGIVGGLSMVGAGVGAAGAILSEGDR